MTAPVLLTPSLQRYAWGDPRFIPEALGFAPSGEPCAEAWYGAHPHAPATARTDEGDVPLDRLLAARGEELLGRDVRERFGGLPYLLKLLAAARPLSIQVHPDLAQAGAGFAREEAVGVPRDAAERCYRDANHKPEVLAALTPFDALCGFRPPEEIGRVLEALPELRPLLPGWEPGPEGLRALLEAWFAIPSERLGPALVRLVARLEAEEVSAGWGPRAPEPWALRAHRALSSGGPPDRGLLFVFLLAFVHLEPGQALFLPAGVPHAYLQGAGVELMASSDNVLRAGLTSKHVDAAELLRVVRCEAGSPPILEPVEDAEGVEGVYPIPAAELDLRRLRVTGGRPVERTAAGPETLLALPDASDGAVDVVHPDGRLELRSGAACLVPAGIHFRLEAVAPATIYRARVPDGAARPGA